jgi:uncharacterized membrane protein/voltage-gated potassium channel Kch
LARIPLILLAIVFVLLLSLAVAWPQWAAKNEAALGRLAAVIWICVVVDYVVSLVLAPDRRRFVREHVVELVAVVVPALRLLLPMFVVLRRTRALSRDSGLAQRVLVYVSTVAAASTVLIAEAMVLVERDAPDSTITTFGEALWWAAVTVATVGYGDFFPVTQTGRLLAVVEMTIGIVFIGTVTAAVASWFVGRARNSPVDTGPELSVLLNEVRQIRGDLDDLRARRRGAPTPAATDVGHGIHPLQVKSDEGLGQQGGERPRRAADQPSNERSIRQMSTMTVWKFPTSGGAEDAAARLRDLQSQGLITVHDAAVVSWEEGKKKPKTRQMNNLAGAGALGGAFWGMLFGLIFLVPLLGAAIGAAAGALAGSLADVGIDDNFIKRVREEVTPGTSAIFLLTSDAVTDRVREAFAGQQMELIHSNLSTEQQAKLREVFAEA